jgi:transposase
MCPESPVVRRLNRLGSPAGTKRRRAHNYDNLSSAVRKILRGFRREETTRFLAFRSHWQFAAEFCTPGEGHEKGGVEGEAGYSGGITGCRSRRPPTWRR